MESTSDSFEIALNRFRSRLTPEERSQFSNTQLQDVKLAMASIQADQRKRKGLRNLTRVKPFLESMEQLGKVIEVFANTSPFVAFIWGPVKLLLQTASNTANIFDSLLDAYEELGEHFPLLLQYEELFRADYSMQAVLVLMYEDILYFHQKALRIFIQPMWQRLFRDLWSDFGPKFKDILKQLQRHKSLVESQGRALHLQQYQADRNNMFEEFKRQRADKLDENFFSIKGWINAVSIDKEHERISNARERYQRTGQWIFNLPEIRQWKDTQKVPRSSTVWLNGIPGAGKTVLASIIIDQLQKTPDRSTAYFYCRHNDPEKRSFISILKSLLSQMLTQQRHLVPHFRQRQLAHGENTLNSEKRCEDLLDTILKNTAATTLVIDGLDECPIEEREKFLKYITEIVHFCDNQEPGKLRILILSQDEMDIRRLLPTATKRRIVAYDNHHDIEYYVNVGRQDLLNKFDRLTEEHAAKIANEVCEQAQGSFLFAKLVMENLWAQWSFEHLEEESSNIPKGLEEAYERVVNRIKNNPIKKHQQVARKILDWVACSKRPLLWQEIQVMLSVDATHANTEHVTVNHATIDPNKRLVVHVKDICGSLVDVLPGDKVVFVHQTASYYLTQSGFLDEMAAEMSMATTCLQYLTLNCFQCSGSSQKDFEYDSKSLYEGECAFEDYAIAWWIDHFVETVDLLEDAEEPLLSIEQSLVCKSFCRATADFYEIYEEDFEPDNDKNGTMLLCRKLAGFPYYDPELLEVFSHARAFHSIKDDRRDEISIKQLGSSLKRHRDLLQTWRSTSTSAQREQLSLSYGWEWFKCSKRTCLAFHEGFRTEGELGRHRDRHERPFRCADPNCLGFTNGFALKRELEKHNKIIHAEDRATFASLQEVPVHMEKNRKWGCQQCGKKFTRNHNLKAHARSHDDVRIYACRICGKTFVRKGDRKRHEDTVHRGDRVPDAE